VEDKYVTCKNLAFNHALDSKGGEEWEQKQLGLTIVMMYVQIYSRIERKYAKPGEGVNVRKKYIGV
jgi:hypothetical protein